MLTWFSKSSSCMWNQWINKSIKEYIGFNRSLVQTREEPLKATGTESETSVRKWSAAVEAWTMDLALAWEVDTMDTTLLLGITIRYWIKTLLAFLWVDHTFVERFVATNLHASRLCVLKCSTALHSTSLPKSHQNHEISIKYFSTSRK